MNHLFDKFMFTCFSLSFTQNRFVANYEIPNTVTKIDSNRLTVDYNVDAMPM